MTKSQLALVLALSLSACAAESSCPEPVGTWTITATETSGTCGSLSPETGPLLGSTAAAGAFIGARGPNCAGEWTRVDACHYSLTRACTPGQTVMADLMYESANRWTGSGTGSSDGSGGFACSSTFTITADR